MQGFLVLFWEQNYGQAPRNILLRLLPTCLHCQAFLCILFAQLNAGLSRTDEK